ncbi:MAG: hypothetical protein PHI35_08485, partial [Victivallaceae bacterium]|nr:hypothetical protein [Victivallaceae bacterium]
ISGGQAVYEPHLTSRDYWSPKGWQLFRLTAGAGELLVIHTFGDPPEAIELPFVPGREVRTLKHGMDCEFADGRLRIEHPADFSAAVIVSRR